MAYQDSEGSGRNYDSNADGYDAAIVGGACLGQPDRRGNGGYRLEVKLHALLPGVIPEEAGKTMTEAHVTCPYSKALRGDTVVMLKRLAGPGLGISSL